MKKSLLFIATIVATSVFSQVTLTKAFNDPIVGETVNNNVVTGTVDNSATGSGATFSNSSLTMGAAAATTYVAPTAAEIATFPNSTIKQNDGSGTSIFYKQSTTKLEITGLVTPDATLNFSVDNGTATAYPTTFGNSYTDNAKGTFTSTTASGLFSGTINSQANASGTLLIGPNTYTNVLRVKVVQNFNLHQSTDTMYLFPIGNITNTMYIYYNAANKFPLLTSTDGTVTIPLLSINQTNSSAVAQNFVFLGTNDEVIFKEDVRLYPNPTQDILNISGNKKFSDAEIFSAEGRLLKSLKIDRNSIDVSFLTAGNHMIILKGKDVESQTLFFIKK